MRDLRLIEHAVDHRRRQRRPALQAPQRATLLDLVVTVQDFARSDEEVVQVISHMLESGTVVLCGTFAGRRIEIGH